MTKDHGPATKDQEPWPWPMAMAWEVAATLRVKYEIDFISESQGGPPLLRVKYKIDFIFDSEGPGRMTATQPVARWPLAMPNGQGPWPQGPWPVATAMAIADGHELSLIHI